MGRSASVYPQQTIDGSQVPLPLTLTLTLTLTLALTFNLNLNLNPNLNPTWKAPASALAEVVPVLQQKAAIVLIAGAVDEIKQELPLIE